MYNNKDLEIFKSFFNKQVYRCRILYPTTHDLSFTYFYLNQSSRLHKWQTKLGLVNKTLKKKKKEKRQTDFPFSKALTNFCQHNQITHQHVISQSLQLLSYFVVGCDGFFIGDLKCIPLNFEFS